MEPDNQFPEFHEGPCPPSHYLSDARYDLRMALSFTYMTIFSILRVGSNLLGAASAHFRQESDIIDAKMGLDADLEGQPLNE